MHTRNTASLISCNLTRIYIYAQAGVIMAVLQPNARQIKHHICAMFTCKRNYTITSSAIMSANLSLSSFSLPSMLYRPGVPIFLYEHPYSWIHLGSLVPGIIGTRTAIPNAMSCSSPQGLHGRVLDALHESQPRLLDLPLLPISLLRGGMGGEHRTRPYEWQRDFIDLNKV